MMCFFHTCAIIDHRRDRQAAVEFMRGQGTRPPVWAITAAELFAGFGTRPRSIDIDALCERLLIHQVDLETPGWREVTAADRSIAKAHGWPTPSQPRAAPRGSSGDPPSRHFPMLDDIVVPWCLS
jgi:hypothetical protein